MNELTEEEKAEVAARKRHKSINQRIRGARGTTVEVPIGTPKASKQMGSFIRASTGRTNGRDDKKAIMSRKVAAVSKGYLIDSEGNILFDVRSKAEKEAQGDVD